MRITMKVNDRPTHVVACASRNRRNFFRALIGAVALMASCTSSPSGQPGPTQTAGTGGEGASSPRALGGSNSATGAGGGSISRSSDTGGASSASGNAGGSLPASSNTGGSPGSRSAGLRLPRLRRPAPGGGGSSLLSSSMGGSISTSTGGATGNTGGSISAIGGSISTSTKTGGSSSASGGTGGSAGSLAGTGGPKGGSSPAGGGASGGGQGGSCSKGKAGLEKRVHDFSGGWRPPAYTVNKTAQMGEPVIRELRQMTAKSESMDCSDNISDEHRKFRGCVV